MHVAITSLVALWIVSPVDHNHGVHSYESIDDYIYDDDDDDSDYDDDDDDDDNYVDDIDENDKSNVITYNSYMCEWIWENELM